MLQVTVDDLGFDPSIDEAAMHLIDRGVISSVTLMVNYPNSARTAEWLRSQPNVSVGIHLNVSSGAPTSNPEDVSTLVDRDGQFHSPRTGLFRGEAFSQAIEDYTGNLDVRVKAEHLSKELESQAQEFRRILARPPEFLTLHHDLDKSPLVRNIANLLFPNLPGRAQRIADGAIEEYVCQFAYDGEPFSEYSCRSLEYLAQQRSSKGARLVVFHPASSLVPMTFTVYNEGRLLEYEFLISLVAQHILADSVPEH